MSVFPFAPKKKPLCIELGEKARRISGLVQERIDERVEKAIAAAADVTAAIEGMAQKKPIEIKVRK